MLSVEERRNKIVLLVNQKNEVDITELAEITEVSESTIYNDLAFLEKKKLLLRTQKGAIVLQQTRQDPLLALEIRSSLFLEEKKRIGRFVSTLIKDGESIMIDGGSTTLLCASYLSAKKNLLVITNAVSIGNIFLKDSSRHNKVLLIGGDLDRSSKANLGIHTIEVLKTLRANKAVIGTAGLTEDGICSVQVENECKLKNCMITCSQETILVTDSSKLGKKYDYQFSNLADIKTLITDVKIQNQDKNSFTHQGTTVYSV